MPGTNMVHKYQVKQEENDQKLHAPLQIQRLAKQAEESICEYPALPEICAQTIVPTSITRLSQVQSSAKKQKVDVITVSCPGSRQLDDPPEKPKRQGSGMEAPEKYATPHAHPATSMSGSRRGGTGGLINVTAVVEQLDLRSSNGKHLNLAK